MFPVRASADTLAIPSINEESFLCLPPAFSELQAWGQSFSFGGYWIKITFLCTKFFPGILGFQATQQLNTSSMGVHSPKSL